MLVFHAGPHKTATSYLQENLRRARGALDKRGWCYPRQGTGGTAGHHDLVGRNADWLKEDSKGRRELTRVPRDRSLVFSAEGAARWPPEHYHALAGLLGKDRVDVVYALRDPIDLFRSHWTEQIKQGQTMGLGERMAEHFADPWSSALLNPLPVLQALAGDPGIRLHVIPFEVLKARKIDIFSHFCDAVLGLDGMSPGGAKPRNVAPAILETEFLRLVTLMAADGARRISSTLRHRFMAETTGPERRAFGNLIRVHGVPARRRVEFPAPHPFKVELENRLRERLRGCWTLEPGEAPLYGCAGQEYIYYDAYGLMQNPEIAVAVEQMFKRLHAGGHTTHGVKAGLAKARAGLDRLRKGMQG